jgi:hypothetical protein
MVRPSGTRTTESTENPLRGEGRGKGRGRVVFNVPMARCRFRSFGLPIRRLCSGIGGKTRWSCSIAASTPQNRGDRRHGRLNTFRWGEREFRRGFGRGATSQKIERKRGGNLRKIVHRPFEAPPCLDPTGLLEVPARSRAGPSLIVPVPFSARRAEKRRATFNPTRPTFGVP